MKRSTYVLAGLTIAAMLAVPFIADAAYRSRVTTQSRTTTNQYQAYSSTQAGATQGAVGPEGQPAEGAAGENPLIEGRKMMADPNAIAAKIKQYPDLEPVLEKLSLRSRTEVSQWLAAKEGDHRIAIIRAMHIQTTAEMTEMRKLAEADGAKKTAAAIDAMMLERQSRYELLVKNIMEQQREETTRNQNTGRTGRTNIRGRTGGRTAYPGRRR